MAYSEEEPEGRNPPFRLPQNSILRRAVGSSQLLSAGAETQGHLRSREERSPPAGRPQGRQPRQHFPRLPGVGAATGRFRVKPAREAQPRRASA